MIEVSRDDAVESPNLHRFVFFPRLGESSSTVLCFRGIVDEGWKETIEGVLQRKIKEMRMQSLAHQTFFRFWFNQIFYDFFHPLFCGVFLISILLFSGRFMIELTFFAPFV